MSVMKKRSSHSQQLIIDDLSFRKPTNQTHGYDARYTVDGNHSTCMDTVNGSPVTWYLDLQEVKSIAKIWILYKNSAVNGRFVYNYKVYLSNTTRWRDGFPCISDAGPSAALPGTVKECPTIARYVIFHNTRGSDSSFNFSSVCDVKLEGCQKNGVFGSYCDKQCPENCNGNQCRIEDGECYSCKNGWMGNKCRLLCSFGKYGPGCNNSCIGQCLRNSTCNPFTGLCEEGCAQGWREPCNIPCAPEWYGVNCSKPCSKNCLNGKCNAKDGTCSSGCKPGYMNRTCNQVCSSGFYGKDCLQNCSGHCYGNKTCDPVDGSCKICAEEYIGKKCDRLKKGEHRLRDSDPVPLAVIVGVPTSVIVLVVIAVMVICYRRRSLNSLENSQATRSDENLKESEFRDDSHQYETLNFSQKHI